MNLPRTLVTRMPKITKITKPRGRQSRWTESVKAEMKNELIQAVEQNTDTNHSACVEVRLNEDERFNSVRNMYNTLAGELGLKLRYITAPDDGMRSYTTNRNKQSEEVCHFYVIIKGTVNNSVSEPISTPTPIATIRLDTDGDIQEFIHPLSYREEDLDEVAV